MTDDNHNLQHPDKPDKLIAFVGTGNYDKVTYVLGEQAHRTCYVPAALAHLQKPKQVLILATEQAEREHWRFLQQEIKRVAEPSKVMIKLGENEDELWEIFAAGTDEAQIKPGERVIFDITHSFRHLPFLAFLSIAFLRVARNVRVEGIYYGAYEVEDKWGRRPILNLKPLVDLLDWTTATYLFLQTGHAGPLVECLNRSAGSQVAQAKGLEMVSAALRLARPDEARKLIDQWAQMLNKNGYPNDSFRDRPFQLLLERVQTELRRITPETPNDDDLEQELREELELIYWNRDRGQLMSAVTVAREWLVSLMCWHARWTELNAKGIHKWRSNQREKAEKALNALAYLEGLDEVEQKNKVGQQTPPAQDLWIRQPDYAKLLVRTWNTVSGLRNDLNHAGKTHSKAPRPLSDILEEAQAVPELLQTLFEESGLNGDQSSKVGLPDEE